MTSLAADRDLLGQSVQFLKGVGPARADLLHKLGIVTVADLLFHFPRSYDDLSDIREIGELSAGELQTVQGEIVQIEGRSLNDGRCVVSIVLADSGGKCLEGVWFNQAYAARGYRYGQRLAFSGKPKWYRDHWQMSNPRVQILDGTQEDASSTVVPVYPLTENLRADQLRGMIKQAVERGAGLVPDILPPSQRTERGFPGVAQALRDLHFPTSLAAAITARRRFVYEELLVLQVALAVRRRELRDRLRAPKLPVTPAIDAHIRRLFPFPLTADQDRAVAAISRDLAKERPMQRLLQADVGAGKTAVAVYALLVAVASKHQGVLMAPTEVLAQQHWRTIQRYLAKSRVRRLLLTGALTPAQRRQALADIKEGNVDLVVGTQALVQEKVQFARLGLVVIDEQHKFGVAQRARVRRLGTDPHYLVMTATPIPRTIALTVFGDLDVSTIRQLPPGRQPVVTRWLTESQRERTYEKLRTELRRGRQAFFVCPLVDEVQTLGARKRGQTPSGQEGNESQTPRGLTPFSGPELKAAQKTFAELKEGPFRDFRVGLLHGRLDDEAKDQVMEQFRRHELDLLVATVVIEVGVDVPNATLLVVEHAERFGLSQLHQLRGRVSRGTVAGECFLFTGQATDDAKQRLRTFTRTSDGFALAEQDARLRGLGEFFGTRQHGLGELRVADLIADRDTLELARADALALVSADARLRQPDHALLRQTVLRKYGKTLDLAEIG
jgi:ATP-dependent DNA helicase RecG